MRAIVIALVLSHLDLGRAGLSQDAGLVGRWDFYEGHDAIAHDRSKQGNHGRLHGPAWVKRGKGHALSFDGVDDYVDCGNHASLDLRATVSIEAWVKPACVPSREPMIVGKYYDSFGITMYKDAKCWFYISGGVNHVAGSMEPGAWNHVVATFDGTTMALYVNGRTTGSGKSKFDRINRGRNLLMGVLVADPKASDPGYSGTCYWKGLLDDVSVYSRALSEEEAACHYKRTAGGYGVDTSWFDRMRVSLYQLPAEQKVLAVLDFSRVLPRPTGATVKAALLRRGSAEPLQVQELKGPRTSGRLCASLAMAGLLRGEYVIRAELLSPNRPAIRAEQAFSHPAPALTVPLPTSHTVAPLPPVPGPPKFAVEMSPGGGFVLSVRDRRFRVESTFSYPHGGENRLAAGVQDGAGEPKWRVTTRAIGQNSFEAVGSGRFYSVTRHIRVHRNRVSIQDAIRNETDQDLGLIIDNYLDAAEQPFLSWVVAGYPNALEREGFSSPSSFATWEDFGIGILPLDDVFVVQSNVYAKDNRLGASTKRFGLAPGASYTLEWAVYPVGTPDYYEFINAVRRDEQRIRTVAGGFGFIPRENVSREFVRLRGLAYGSFGCLANVADDPEIEIEGIEFLWLPKQRARLRSQFEAIHKVNPDLKLMFHVAHSLVSTNKPSELFPDSRVIDVKGKHVVYNYDYYYGSKWFSRRRLDEGWRWYIYYPTPGNSFHDALMRSVDVMVDDIGCNGAFMDGFLWGYASRWTYDRWDGHTVEMDPETKTIKRKVGSVLLLSQPSMVEFARRMHAKGAVVVANNVIMTRSIAALPTIVDQECVSGPNVHLAQTPCALGNPKVLKNETDVYEDVLDKLKWGNLYLYYGEPRKLTYPSLPQQMYPITVEEIHSGTVKGTERLITMRSGVYGWRDSNDLHFAYRYNPVGMRVPATFVTTVDSAGVRTRVDLQQAESAVVKRIPVTLRSARPLNLVCERYDASEVNVLLNGESEVELVIRDGEFPVKAEGRYRTSSSAEPLTVGSGGKLKIPVALRGQMRLRVTCGEP